MKWLWGDKDDGPESKVYVWGLEIKSLFSVLLLRFDQGSREAHHTHAFNALSWVLYGRLREDLKDLLPTNDPDVYIAGYFYSPSPRPVFTARSRFHKVTGLRPRTWVLTLRGPWKEN